MGFYGQADVVRCEESWSLLNRLSQMSIHPWLCAYDFNETLHHQESKEEYHVLSGRLRIFDNVSYNVMVKSTTPAGAMIREVIDGMETHVMDDMITELIRYFTAYESAFVLGRLITDNALLAYELNHFLLHKTWGQVGHLSLKVDISKAYDRVEWVFFQSVLLRIVGVSDKGTLFFHIYSCFVERHLVTWCIELRDMGLQAKNVMCQRTSLASILGVQVVAKHAKYLGLPRMLGKSKGWCSRS
ncbi:UNVERIFIED_CONTAM: hypothetical protein Scaly_1656600 [Sesamum calycinum]|uniref:Reverse transcriptase n=1 Tax=Sesamum calycinum TaxID=2727403 RepID=A0AAW2NVA4_9LAMI